MALSISWFVQMDESSMRGEILYDVLRDGSIAWALQGVVIAVLVKSGHCCSRGCCRVAEWQLLDNCMAGQGHGSRVQSEIRVLLRAPAAALRYRFSFNAAAIAYCQLISA